VIDIFIVDEGGNIRATFPDCEALHKLLESLGLPRRRVPPGSASVSRLSRHSSIPLVRPEMYVKFVGD
jgi:hypothetical protein